GIRSADNFLSNFQPFRLKNVALLAVGVRQQCNAWRTIGIVLDANNGRRNPGLVALEVDDPQLTLVATADKAHGHVARVAPSASTVLGLKQWLVRVLRRDVVVDDRRAIAQRLRRRSVCLNRHMKLSALGCQLSACLTLPSL